MMSSVLGIPFSEIFKHEFTCHFMDLSDGSMGYCLGSFSLVFSVNCKLDIEA